MDYLTLLEATLPDLIVVMTAPTEDSEARGIALKSVALHSDSEE